MGKDLQCYGISKHRKTTKHYESNLNVQKSAPHASLVQ